jgi:pimeloyl-ACP methyl ester carboxylesterase
VLANREQCARVENAVWADAGDYGAECLRFWAAGFDGKPAKRALIFFHGDVDDPSAGYLQNSMEKLQASADRVAKGQGIPYIFFGRPGTHGSSGDHMQRRRLQESMLISAAMDAIKQRFGITEWVVAGQSGGGHVTAALLTERADIVCAVPTSSPSSPSVRYKLRGRSVDTTGYSDSYEPIEHLDRSRMHPALRVFVLGDPEDKNVFWASQTILADRLKVAGVAVAVLTGEGAGPDRHQLANSAVIIGSRCARGESTEEIEARAARGLKG